MIWETRECDLPQLEHSKVTSAQLLVSVRLSIQTQPLSLHENGQVELRMLATSELERIVDAKEFLLWLRSPPAE